jgi:hypothetical protein
MYNATHFVIYHNKNALKSPGKIYRGLFLIFLKLKLRYETFIAITKLPEILHCWRSAGVSIELLE